MAMKPVLTTALTLVLGATVFAGDPLYTIEPTVARQGFDRKMCWVHARAGTIPPGSEANPAQQPLVVMTLQKLQLSGSDVFYALNEMRTADGGRTWSAPREHPSFARVPFRFRDQTDLEITVCDFTPRWHAQTGKLLGTGHTVVYENNRVMHTRPRGTAYAVYDPEPLIERGADNRVWVAKIQWAHPNTR